MVELLVRPLDGKFGMINGAGTAGKPKLKRETKLFSSMVLTFGARRIKLYMSGMVRSKGMSKF